MNEERLLPQNVQAGGTYFYELNVPDFFWKMGRDFLSQLIIQVATDDVESSNLNKSF